MKVRKAVTAGVLAVALVVLAACGGGDSTPGPVDTVNMIGDVVRLGNKEVVVHAFKDPFDSGNQVVKAPAGSRQVAVEVEVKNLATEPQILSGFSQFEMRDSSEKSFDAIPLPATVPSIGGLTQPGTSRRGFVGFHVPEGATGLQVVFTNPLVVEGSVKYALT